MRSIKNMLFMSLFFVLVFAKATDYRVNKNAEIIVNGSDRPVVIESSMDLIPQNREEIDLFVEDFENGLYVKITVNTRPFNKRINLQLDFEKETL